MRIAFLSRYFGQRNRGAETYVLELSKALSTNHQIDILSGGDADSFKKLLKGNYDFVIPTNGRIQALKASLARLKSRYKLIISGQAGMGWDDIWNIAIVCPDVYVALTETERDWGKKWAWRTKVDKIPNGVDLQRFNPKGERVETGLSGRVVLSVGALYWYKHHERTIKAVAKTDHSLLIIGSGPNKKNLTKEGDILLGKKRFKILELDFKSIDKYYRSADVFTLPSWDREAFGIVYLEAMATNLPVVAPDDLTRREIVGQGGLLTHTEDTEEYAHSINEALEKKWKDLPRKQAENFSWNNIASQYENLFRELNR